MMHFHKIKNLFFLSLAILLVFLAQPAKAQTPSQAYIDLMASLEEYVQGDLYGKVSSVLYDPEVIPPAEDYINFCKQVYKELGMQVKEYSSKMKAEEVASAMTFTQNMMVQLGELYLDRGQELETAAKMAFFEAYFEGVGLYEGMNRLSEDLARSTMMTMYAAMDIPFGMPNSQIGDYIQALPEPRRELFMASALLNDMSMLFDGFERSEQRMAEFSKNYPKSPFLPQLQSNLQSLEKLREGAVVENFNFVDMEGKTVSLADYKDKIIYLDLWASWCGPCIQTFRTKTPDFEKALRDREDVVLMYISIDDKEDPWKNYLSKNPMRGVHLYAGQGFEADIMKYFKVWGIPRYIVLGKGNTIVRVNAPRPGDEALDLLESLKGS